MNDDEKRRKKTGVVKRKELNKNEQLGKLGKVYGWHEADMKEIKSLVAWNKARHWKGYVQNEKTTEKKKDVWKAKQNLNKKENEGNERGEGQ